MLFTESELFAREYTVNFYVRVYSIELSRLIGRYFEGLLALLFGLAMAITLDVFQL